LACRAQASNPYRIISQCMEGYYGLPGDATCEPCPAHAMCPGGALDPLPLAGYYKVSRSLFAACTPPEACQAMPLPGPAELAARTQSAFGAPGTGGGGVIVAAANSTTPPSAAANCASAYAGSLCGDCAANYYRKNVVCVPCPQNGWLLIVLFVAGAIVLGFIIQFVYQQRQRLKVRRAAARGGTYLHMWCRSNSALH
jgi:hypothetical protein